MSEQKSKSQFNYQENDKYKNRFKDFSAQKKLDLSLELYHSAKELKRYAMKEFHPEWNDDKIRDELRKVFLHART